MQAPLVKTAFPAGYCWPSTPEQFATDLYSLSYANVQDNVTGVAYGPTDPGPTTKLWYNSTVHRQYEWDATIGRRIALYWPPGDPNIKLIVEMTETEIAAWDNPGGAAAVLGAELWTGPFWAIDHNYDARIPIGVGLLPLSATNIPLSGVNGADMVPITTDNIPKHRHYINVGPESGDSSYLADLATSENGTFKVNGAEQIRFYDLPSPEVGRTRENESLEEKLDIMPPYRGVYVVKRTPRIYYTL